MAETMINGAAGNADFKIATQSYKTVVSRFRVRMDTRQLDATVFSNEPNTAMEPGNTQARFDLTAYGKQGAISSGLMALPQQGVALTFTYTTGCTVAFTGNFETIEGERIVNQNMIVTGSGVSTSAIVVTWNIGS